MIDLQPPSHSGSPYYREKLSFQGFSHHPGTFYSICFDPPVNCTCSQEFHNKVIFQQIDCCLLISGPNGTTSECKTHDKNWHPIWGLLITHYHLCYTTPLAVLLEQHVDDSSETAKRGTERQGLSSSWPVDEVCAGLCQIVY